MTQVRLRAPVFVIVMVALVAITAIVGGVGVGAGLPGEAAALTVFGAADLAFALQELAPRFEKAVGVKVTLVLEIGRAHV